jgi:aldehyde:ferredoxin oxidoreductase
MEENDARWETDWPLARQAYYQARGLDEQGYPTAEALRAAGLDFVVADMARWKR